MVASKLILFPVERGSFLPKYQGPPDRPPPRAPGPSLGVKVAPRPPAGAAAPGLGSGRPPQHASPPPRGRPSAPPHFTPAGRPRRLTPNSAGPAAPPHQRRPSASPHSFHPTARLASVLPGRQLTSPPAPPSHSARQRSGARPRPQRGVGPRDVPRAWQSGLLSSPIMTTVRGPLNLNLLKVPLETRITFGFSESHFPPYSSVPLRG